LKKRPGSSRSSSVLLPSAQTRKIPSRMESQSRDRLSSRRSKSRGDRRQTPRSRSPPSDRNIGLLVTKSSADKRDSGVGLGSRSDRSGKPTRLFASKNPYIKRH
jgi:hypothetical protein